MTILFILTIAVFAAILAYQNDWIRQRFKSLLSAKYTRLVLIITVLSIIAIFYPAITAQIKKLKQKLNSY